MTVTVEELVRQIHSRPVQLVLATTGGGSQAIADLLKVPGASRTVLEAIVPYAARSLHRFLKAQPEGYCSPRTARAMAMAAFCRATDLADNGNSPLLGIGCTASLASDRPKRGAHRLHAAIQTIDFTETISLELSKGARSRADEELLAGQLLLNLIASAIGIDWPSTISFEPGEQVTSKRTQAEPGWKALMLGQTRIISANEAGRATIQQGRVEADHLAIFPGAFNPLHKGHCKISQLAESLLGKSVGFEISIENVDKPPLDYTEMQTRVAQFLPNQLLWLTRAPTFVEKSRLFPGATFLVGADTILRIADPRYYHADAAACQSAIHEISANGCHFLVFGRLVGDEFVTLETANLPCELQAICHSVPTHLFHVDISSTELRRSWNDDDKPSL